MAHNKTGGRQQQTAEGRESVAVSHVNVTIEVPVDDEARFGELLREFCKSEGATFFQVGWPVRYTGMRCPHCSALIHFHAVDCHHCKHKIQTGGTDGKKEK